MEVEENPLANMSEEEVMGLLGTFLAEPSAEFARVDVDENMALPETFDGRTHWGKCVGPILNQARCGSCWAFGASESLSDRWCIQGGKPSHDDLSAQDLVSCDRGNMACQGGWLDVAFNYLENSGIVSEACWPYSSSQGAVEACRTTCSGAGTWKKHHCNAGSTTVAIGAAAMKQDLYQNGPTEVAFQVFQDFMQYKSGVYRHTSGGFLGGHAVKLIGWGHEDGLDYWLLSNSWGNKWGMEGFFKFKQGDCNIDAGAYGCRAALNSQAAF